MPESRAQGSAGRARGTYARRAAGRPRQLANTARARYNRLLNRLQPNVDDRFADPRAGLIRARISASGTSLQKSADARATWSPGLSAERGGRIAVSSQQIAHLQPRWHALACIPLLDA